MDSESIKKTPKMIIWIQWIKNRKKKTRLPGMLALETSIPGSSSRCDVNFHQLGLPLKTAWPLPNKNAIQVDVFLIVSRCKNLRRHFLFRCFLYDKVICFYVERHPKSQYFFIGFQFFFRTDSQKTNTLRWNMSFHQLFLQGQSKPAYKRKKKRKLVL